MAALGSLVGRKGAKFRGLDIKRVYFGCVLRISSITYSICSNQPSSSKKLVTGLQSGSSSCCAILSDFAICHYRLSMSSVSRKCLLRYGSPCSIMIICYKLF
jgi:hypothetical protein